MRPESLDRYPALAASAVLHVGVVVLALLLGRLLDKPIYGPAVVPVTLINTSNQNPAPAVESPRPTPPTPEVAPPQPPAPAPAPAPPKPAPTPPQPTPKPAPVAPSKTPVKPQPQAPDDEAFFSSLSKDLASSAKPAQPRTASRPVAGTGSAASAAALASLSAQLQRLWNPNCDVLGGDDINLTVKFVLGPSGRVIGQPVSTVGASADPIVKAASDRAIRAVFQAQPITGLNPDHYTVNFNGRQACGSR